METPSKPYLVLMSIAAALCLARNRLALLSDVSWCDSHFLKDISTGPSPGFSSRGGPKTRWSDQKPEGRPHF